MLAGIDISAKMVDKARELGRGYTQLLVGDIDELLAMPPSGDGVSSDEEGSAESLGQQCFELILCTDTFVYYGDLCEVFALSAGRMAPGDSSLFVVTLELLPEEEAHGEPWRLQKTGTYVHTRATHGLARGTVP